MLGRTANLILILLLAFAGPSWSADPVQSACKISINYGRSTSSLSGVVVAVDENRVWILTNAHGFRDGNNPRSITVYPPSHPPIECDAIDYIGNADDKGDDLAIVSGESTSPPPVVELAEASPRPGEEVYLVGYPGGGEISVRPARRTSIHSSSDHYDAPSEQGMSGGPVFFSGRLCSLIWGGGAMAGDCYAVPLPRIRAVLQRVLGIKQRTPLATDGYLVPATQCPGGVCNPDFAPMPQPSLPMSPPSGWQPSRSPRIRPIDPIATVPVQVPPAAPRVEQPTTPIATVPVQVPVVEPVQREPDPEPVSRAIGIDWPDLAAKSVVAAASAVGLGVPAWLVIAWRGASVARRAIGRRRSTEPDGFRSSSACPAFA